MLNSLLENYDINKLPIELSALSSCDDINSSVNIERINYKKDQNIVISLLLPTRKRLLYLNNFIDSLLKRTDVLNNIEVIIYIDDDDISSKEFFHKDISYTKITGPRLTMGEYNSVCYHFSSGKIIMLVNDDVVIETNNWDSLLVHQLEKFDDEIYLAYPDDDSNHGKLSTFPVLSRKTCEALVYPYPFLYKRLFIDTHIMDVFQRLIKMSEQRIVYLENIKFLHYKLDSHFDNEESYQRTDYHDDFMFISLRRLRESQAARLKSVINREELPSIETKVILKDGHKNYLNSLVCFYRNFITDKGLPTVVRIKYFVWYAGHFFMIKTSFGMFISKIIHVMKRHKINPVTC